VPVFLLNVTLPNILQFEFFSLRLNNKPFLRSKKICSHPGRNSIYSIVKVIYAGVLVSRKKGNVEFSVICVEVMVYGTRRNESTEPYFKFILRPIITS